MVGENRETRTLDDLVGLQLTSTGSVQAPSGQLSAPDPFSYRLSRISTTHGFLTIICWLWIYGLPDNYIYTT